MTCSFSRGGLCLESFSVQGEYAQLETTIPISVASVSPTYNGWYVDASWFLTGEMRTYQADTGEFRRVKVKNPVFGVSGAWGAWQIAGRYDVIDLSDKVCFGSLADELGMSALCSKAVIPSVCTNVC
jgi:phosphate-selective porin OprO/OprP